MDNSPKSAPLSPTKKSRKLPNINLESIKKASMMGGIVLLTSVVSTQCQKIQDKKESSTRIAEIDFHQKIRNTLIGPDADATIAKSQNIFTQSYQTPAPSNAVAIYSLKDNIMGLVLLNNVPHTPQDINIIIDGQAVPGKYSFDAESKTPMITIGENPYMVVGIRNTGNTEFTTYIDATHPHAEQIPNSLAIKRTYGKSELTLSVDTLDSLTQNTKKIVNSARSVTSEALSPDK